MQADALQADLHAADEQVQKATAALDAAAKLCFMTCKYLLLWLV